MSKQTKNSIIIALTYLVSLFLLTATPLYTYYLMYGTLHSDGKLFAGAFIWLVFSLGLAAAPCFVAAIIYNIVPE